MLLCAIGPGPKFNAEEGTYCHCQRALGQRVQGRSRRGRSSRLLRPGSREGRLGKVVPSHWMDREMSEMGGWNFGRAMLGNVRVQ